MAAGSQSALSCLQAHFLEDGAKVSWQDGSLFVEQPLIPIFTPTKPLVLSSGVRFSPLNEFTLVVTFTVWRAAPGFLIPSSLFGVFAAAKFKSVIWGLLAALATWTVALWLARYLIEWTLLNVLDRVDKGSSLNRAGDS